MNSQRHPFDIDLVLTQVEEAVKPFPKAGLFELAEEGFGSPFELLVACIISIRTYDEVMLPCARRLFRLAQTPLEMSVLTQEQIDTAIKDSTFHERKAQQIAEIAQRIVSEYNGTLPCEKDVLLSFRGVGPKCANLVLGIAADHVAHSYSAMQIVAHYPDLTSAQVHAALTYYYDHQEAMEAALIASYTKAERQRRDHTPHPKLTKLVSARLRQAK